MSITKRITKFLLIAALAIPAWNVASAQNRTAPPEEEAVENVLETTKDLKGHSVATTNAEPRPVEKTESLNAKRVFNLGTPSSKARISKAPKGPKVQGVQPVKTVNKEAKTGQPRRTTVPKLKASELRTDVPDDCALIVFVVGDVWGDGSGYQMLLDKNATMYASWNSNGLSQSIYDMAEYTIPEYADYNASGNATNFLLNQTGQVVVPAGTYDILITNPSPNDKVYIASENGSIGGYIDDYSIAAGKVYTFTVSMGSNGYDQTDLEITSLAETLGQPTNLAANPGATSAEISWEAGLNNDSWNLRYRPYTDIRDYNRLWTFPIVDQSTVTTGGWLLFDYNSDSYNWGYGAADNTYTDAYLYSQSWISGTGAVTPDNWAISPEVKLGGTLKFKARTNGYAETLGVFVYQGDINSASASDLIQEQVGSDLALTSSNTSFAEYTYDLSAYTGYGYIIIRHYNCSDGYNVYVDDIQVIVPENQEVPAEPEWTYVNDATNPYTITGLTPETQYEVQVQGVGNNTTTDWTYSVVFTTLEGQDPTQSLDFGSVDVGGSKTLPAYIDNPSDSPVTATVSVNPNPPFSVASSTSTTVTLAANALTSVDVTFTPAGAQSYTGTLTVIAAGDTTTIPLKGVGNMSGPEAVRDSAFYAGIPYTWTDSEGTHTSTLADVATKPEQIIAMIKEVYTNKSIPGNFKRGCTSAGNFTESFSDVSYPAIGKIEWVGPSNGSLSDLSNYAWTDSYGWGIDNKKDMIYNKYTGYSSSYPIYYTHFDQTEYKPDNEGVTLLLVEVADDYDLETNVNPSSTGAQYLKDVIGGVIKSVRVVTQAKRVGSSYNKGTLFNVDCDKMNKFYFMAKGQLRRPTNSKRATGSTISSATFCPYPMYVYSQNYFGYSSTIDKYVDEYNARPFYQMFEQFSPVSLNTGANINDLYSSLTKMTSFNVVHDCITVPFATHSSEGDVHHGHQFMMYGLESGAADCQDVRDLMFFVPDYRMMDWGDDDGTGRDTNIVPYTNYNEDHAPTMGLYVIIQDSVEAVTRADDYFKLKLTWDSNMDEFLPGEQQEYQLYQVVTDEFGVSSWNPVYYTKVVNNQVVYTDETGINVVTTPVPIVLTLNPSSSKKTYTEVYVPRADASIEVTYAIRGRDTGHFLSLQMSNEQSYVIPGKDPAEMVLMSSATVYSRYEAQNENNCYSNKIQMKAAPKTIKASYLPNGSTMTLNRSYAKVGENNETVTVTEPIAILTVTNSGSSKYFTISGSVLDDVESLFPKGTDNYTAGYHANNFTNNRINFSTQTISGTEYINFDLTIWDNFVANVSKNEHPGLYSYQLRFNTAENFEGLNGSTNEAYSNPIRVYVYKTDSKVNEPLTLDQVKGDTGCNSAYKPGDVEFSAQVQLSSKGEILRYDAYRWVEGAPRSIILEGGATDEDEEDVDPNGMAGNQGDSYTVTMNEVGTDNYYVGSAVPVTETAPLNWAKFVDYYPATLENGGAFTYAPVVELFTKGYQAGTTNKVRGDYNTYGGPLKTTAVGKLELEIPDNLNTDGNPFMSSYKWFDGTNWCAYYKLPVKFTALGIPEGYELYKIRAWRDVDTNILREELSSRQDRIAANYLFEDLTYGDALGDGHTMSKENLFQNHDGTINSYELGRRAIGDGNPQSEAFTGETHATFGALRLKLNEDDVDGAIDKLEATIKVRAYFTKKENNPIFSNPIYVIANSGNGWDYDTPLATLTCEDGANFTGTITISAANDGSGKGYFMFSKQLGSSWDTNAQYIFGPEGDGNKVLGEWPNNEGCNLKYWQSGTKVFEVYPGTYQLSIGSHVQDLASSAQYGYQAGYVTITRVTSKAPTRDEIPANFDYYVAEGSIDFNSNMFDEIITGVTDVKSEANREVMSVSYVNTVGQVSSTPWQGVNVVVVRYTDGSTSTSKVIK